MGLPHGASEIICGASDKTNPFLLMFTQMAIICIMSHIFQMLLKPLGQPAPIAQILAGILIGPSALSRIKTIAEFSLQMSAASYYQFAALLTRMIFMFMLGLELDIASTMRHLKQSAIVAGGAGLMSAIFVAAISPFLYDEIHKKTDMPKSFPFVAMVIVANTASPVVIRLAAELKLTTRNVGQLAISSSLINDVVCLIIQAVYDTFRADVRKSEDGPKPEYNIFNHIGGGIVDVIIVAIVMGFFWGLVWFCNTHHRDKKYLTNTEILIFLGSLLSAAMFVEMRNQSSILVCFAIGLTVRRQGRTARTLLRKLTFPVNTFVLPIYFGYTGFQANIPTLFKQKQVRAVVILVLVSIGGRISGTLAACHLLKIPLSAGVVLALLLNMKGFVDLQMLSAASQDHVPGWFDTGVYNVIVSSIVINTIIAGSIAAFIVKRDGKSFDYHHTPIELQNIESELRILACVHNSHHVSAISGLIASMARARNAPIVPYLIHLLQFHERSRKDLTFHQLAEDVEFFKDAHDYGGNAVVEINEAVDAFISQTGITMRQDKLVSPLATMFKEVCDRSEDFNASVILLSFHKNQQNDLRKDDGTNRRKDYGTEEGFRTTNQKILRHAPCSVAILVDRGAAGTTQVLSADSVHHVAVLFFGGPDDREALALCTRIGLHPHINMTVIKFQHASSKVGDSESNSDIQKDENILMEISTSEKENEVDNAFVLDFYNRYVTTGQIGFVEKFVHNGAETVSALRDMADMYSLFIVGKGGRGHSPIFVGMSDWEECPELGKIGDLLASSDFDIRGYILVVQQQRHLKNDHLDD